MKAKSGFNLREVCGENIIVAEGKENIDFSNIISMNESSAFLWKKVQEKETFTVEDMVGLLMEEYEVEEVTARKDSEMLAAQWGKAGIIEGDDIPKIEVEVMNDLREEAAAASAGKNAEEATVRATPQPSAPKKRSFLQRLFGKR